MPLTRIKTAMLGTDPFRSHENRERTRSDSGEVAGFGQRWFGLHLFLLVFIILLPVTAFAQGGVVCLFADLDGTDCNPIDSAPGMLSIYVIHTLTPGATAVEFSAPKPACMVGATWLADEHVFPVTFGDSQTGVAIGYGACLESPFHVLTIHYTATGGTLPDCAYPVLERPGSGLLSVDCGPDPKLVPATGGTSYLNSTIPCDCETDDFPELGVSPASLDFGWADEAERLTITNVGTGVLSWTASDDQEWMSLSRTGGTGDGYIDVTVSRNGLPLGVYNGSVTISSNGGDVVVPVQMEVAQPILSVTTTHLFYPPINNWRLFTILNVGGGVLSWTVTASEPWMTPSMTSGNQNATIIVSVDRTGLTEGTHTGTVDITSNGGNATVSVEVEVLPYLGWSPNDLFFPLLVVEQPLEIYNRGQGTLNWSCTLLDTSWATIVPPTSGTGDGMVLVRVDRTGLPPETDFETTLRITSNGGDADVTVIMTTRRNVATRHVTWGAIKEIYRK